MTSHEHAMDAVNYWRAYEVKIAWDRPKEVLGTVEALRETRASPSDPYVPRLAIRQDDGVLVIVDAYQQRLLAELVLTKPMVGERIWIRYDGEEKKAARGLNPVKRFRVRVDRHSSPPPDGPVDTGEVLTENESEAGK